MVGWVSGTYWRFINFSVTHLGSLCIRTLPKKTVNQLEWLILFEGIMRLQPIFWGVVGAVTWLLGWFWNIFWGWLVDEPFSKKSFSHIEQWFAINLPDGQTATRDGSNLNCLPAAKQSERWPVLREIWKVETCFFSQKFGLQESTCTPATTQVCTSLGWLLDDAASRQNSVDLKLYPLPVPFAQVLRTLQPANWTLQIDVTLLHVDGRITDHKEIGLGRLLPSWLQDYVLFFQVDRRELWWSYTKVFYRSHSDGSRLPVSPRTFRAFFSHITTAKFNSKDWCYTLAFWWNDHESQRNWTWTPFTQQVGFKMIFLLFNSKLTGVSSDGVRPGPSRDTLMGLHCIH